MPTSTNIGRVSRKKKPILAAFNVNFFFEFEIVICVRPERKAFLLSIIDVVSNLRH